MNGIWNSALIPLFTAVNSYDKPIFLIFEFVISISNALTYILWSICGKFEPPTRLYLLYSASTTLGQTNDKLFFIELS